MPDYLLVCSSCGYQFKAPFTPRSGSPLDCPTCRVKYRDLAATPYVKKLATFLTRALEGIVTVLRTAEGFIYNITITKDGEARKIIGTIIWTPSSKGHLLPNTAIASIQLKQKDKAMKTAIELFIAKYGVEVPTDAPDVRKY